MAGKNPLLNPPSGSAKGGDFVKDPQGSKAMAKGTDFTQKPEGSNAKPRGTDFVATQHLPTDQAHGSPSSRGGPAAAVHPDSVPEGGVDAPEALSSKGVPGAPAQGHTTALRPEGGGSAQKPFKLRQ